MRLISDIRSKGLSSEQIKAIFATEMRDYRNQLEHIVAGWTLEPEPEPYRSTDRNLIVYEAMWSAFAESGIVAPMNAAYAEAHLDRLTEEERADVCLLTRHDPHLREKFLFHAQHLLWSFGIEPNDVNLAVALRAILKGRAQGAKDCREDFSLERMT